MSWKNISHNKYQDTLGVWSDFDKLWLDYLIILWKIDWLNGRYGIWSLSSKFFRCVYHNFVWFHQPKNRQYRSWDLSHGGSRYSATEGALTYRSVINANTYIEQNCDEHPSHHKMTFVNESFILFFNSSTVTLVQVNTVIREWSLDLLITAIEIFAKLPCLGSRGYEQEVRIRKFLLTKIMYSEFHLAEC